MRNHCFTLAVFFFAIISMGIVARADSSLREIADTLPKNGGLAVLLEPDDWTRGSELAAQTRWLIHCLHDNPETVEKAREFYQADGIHGRVLVDRARDERLPYADNLVNVLVIGDVAAMDPLGPRTREIARCLAPGGRIYLPASLDAVASPGIAATPGIATSSDIATIAQKLTTVGLTEKDGPAGWRLWIKPYPKAMDEWTHYLHDSDGNAVSRDTTIGVARSLRWTAGPLWARHHDFASSISAMVSAEGRIFYILDEAPPGVAGMPGNWALVARDAFNGLLLWKRPIQQWGWTHWTRDEVQTFNRQNTPFELTRRLVAVGNRVYVTLGYNAPVSQIDARSGALIQCYEQTRYTSGILHHDGRLILTVGNEPQRVTTPGEQLAEQRIAEKAVMLLDPESGDTLWRKGGYAGVRVRADSERNSGVQFLCAGRDRVFFLEAEYVVCLDLADGSEAWRVPRPEREKQPLRSRIHLSDLGALVYHDGMLYFGQLHPNPTANKDGDLRKQILAMTLLAINVDDGQIRWQYEGAGITCTAPPDVFVNEGLVWIFKAGEPTLLGLDAKTGKVTKSFPADKVLRTRHHHRCYANKATSRYILTAKEGIEYIDIRSGAVATCHWARGVCRYGIMPANGLIYAPSHQCGCFIDAKLNGFLALATQPASSGKGIDAASNSRLEKGPAYDAASTSKSDLDTSSDSADWPMYRQGIERSGFGRSKLSEKLNRRWEANLGGNLTGVTAAAGSVFVASRDTHAVYALDAKTGAIVWRRTASGPVDTPPTFSQGCLFFGSRDGVVHCLQAADGTRAWRFLAAPEVSRIVAFGHLESAWPVHGSVLALDGRIYFTAGRASHLDAGMHAYCLDQTTGKVLRHARFSADTQSVGELQDAALSDILVSDGDSIWMRGRCFEAQDIRRRVEDGRPAPVHATAGLLDDSWFNRTFWTCQGKHPAQYLVFDDETVYGIRAYRIFHWKSFNDTFTPAQAGYQLFAADRNPPGREPEAKDQRRGRTPSSGKWSLQIPLRAQAMAVTDRLLFVAGSPDTVDAEDPWAAFDGKRGGFLYVFSKSDGKKLAEYPLPAPSVYDGMAVAEQRLLLALKNGTVVCFTNREPN